MTIVEPSQEITNRSRRQRVVAAVVGVIALIGVAVLVRLITNDDGPVPADEARIDITYADDGTSFAGDHQVAEGTITVTFTNETDSEAFMAVFGYQTGSTALAEELEFLEEGERGVPSAALPAPGWFDVDFDVPGGALVPGTHTWTMDVGPGTYLFDFGPEDFMTTGLWRAAVIEVVAE